jgi:hypothetical protein
LDSIQQWEDKEVKVRIKARQISDAICDAAEVFIRPMTATNPYVLELRLGMSVADGLDSEVVNIPLTRAEYAGPRVWSMDSSKLEAILGLCVWSIKAQSVKADDDDGHGKRTSDADTVPNAQFAFVNRSKFAALNRDNAKTWMDSNARKLLVSGSR